MLFFFVILLGFVNGMVASHLLCHSGTILFSSMRERGFRFVCFSEKVAKG